MIGYLFTNLLAAIGILYGWLNPFTGLMIYHMFAILRPTFLWFWSWDIYNAPRYSFYVGLSVLFGWLMSGFGDWSKLRGVWMPLGGIALYLFGGFIAYKFYAINPKYAWDSYVPQLKIGLMLLVTITLVRDSWQIKRFAWVTTAALGYLAWVFNSQYWLDGWNRIYSRGFGGIDNNGTAMIMVLGVPLAFFVGVNDRRLWVKFLCFLAAACQMHVVLFSYSRGGQLGLCMVGAVLFIVALIALPRKGLTIGIGILFVLLGFRLAGVEVRERFMSIFVDAGERDASAASRFVTWKAAWACMLDNPMGVGPRNFNIVSRYYGLGPFKSVHNLFLQTGADYGFLGAIGLLIFYVGTIWQTFWMTFTPVARQLVWPRYFGQMVVVSLSGFLVCSTFIGMESVEVGYIIALVGLCTVGYVNRLADDPAAAKRELDAQNSISQFRLLPEPAVT